MQPAKYETTAVKIGAGEYCFTVSTARVAFDGFRSVYVEAEEEKEESNVLVGHLSMDSVLTKEEFDPKQHFTQPPAHYTEASLVKTMEELKEKGIWFVCADMGGDVMYRMNLTGPIGLVIGNEGEGVSKLVREHCDMTASIPMKGDIDSLNASVAAGVLSYEIVRQRMKKG